MIPRPSTVIHSATLVSGGRVDADAWVALQDGAVSARGSGRTWHDAVRPGAEVVDAAGAWLTPGFVDIHVHGAGGASFDDGPADAGAIRRALEVHRAHGTTRSVLSLVTGSIDDLCERLSVIADAAAADETILGSHLEGPFLDAGHKGAHEAALLRPASEDTVARLLEAGRGTIRQITLAPELPGGMDAVARFTDAGVAVAVGHTDADYDIARAAFDAGASILTHAFNGMNGIHHRAPGPVVAAMASDGVTLEVVNDGVHVHPEVVAMVFASARGRVALVTDAMAATGSTDGDYLLGSLEVTVVDGVARLRHGGAIAGSTLTLDHALRQAVLECGIDVATAVAALTETPARAVGRPDLGRLEQGSVGDAVLLDDDFAVTGVWSAGIRLR